MIRNIIDKLKIVLFNDEVMNLKKRGMKVGENVNIINSKIDYGHCWLI